MGRKWNNIKERKAAKDKNTSRLYAKFGIEVYVAAKKGEPDPELNQALKMVIERAKTYNIPRNIIEKALEKAKGNADEKYEEIRYEGFGPSGSMVIVDALTNNLNRTAADVRSAFSKYGGNLGVTGSVTYMFDETAVFAIEEKSVDEIFEIIVDAGIDVRDVFLEDDLVFIYAEPNQFKEIQDVLKTKGITEFAVAEVTMLPQNNITLSEESLVKFNKLIDVLEELDDVQQVYHNVNIEE